MAVTDESTPPETPQIVRGFARPNLALRITEVERAARQAAKEPSGG